VEGVEVSVDRRCAQCGRPAPDDASFCASCGAPFTPRDARHEERRLVSILFVDLEGFTASAEAADPEDVRDALGRYHGVAREQIEAYGGTVEKFIGDAVMAVFGAPTAYGDDAERAVRAGLRVLDAVAELREEGFPLAARAAVNTGEAIVTMERHTTGEALAIGDVVNTAARLQAAAPAGRLVVGAETRRATRYAIGYERLEDVIAKGKAAPVEAWLATEVLSAPAERPERPGRFVGRDRELEIVRSVWRQATLDNRPHVVTVLGPTGIGKSRLCREVSVEIAASGGRILRGRCLPYEEQTGYHASAQLVRHAFGIYDSDPPPVARTKLEDGVAALLPEGEQADTARSLSLLLGLGTDVPAARKRLLFFAMRRMIECLGGERPTLVVFEDIHWAAASELDLIEYLGAHLRDTAAVVILLSRPELLDERPWGARLPEHTSIALDPLTADDARTLAVGLFDEPTASGAETIEQLVDVAEGNPLFLEELAAASAEGASGAGLPVTVTAAISARLDRLPADLREVLFPAAVVGRTFWRDVVVQAVSGSEVVDEALDELERRDLVRREHASRLEGDVEYRFRHALIRDVAYSMLPRAERAERHAEVARYIESRVGADSGPVAWILAHHWRMAGEADRAVPHLLVAAAVAERGWATQEVVDLYSQALDLATRPELRATIRLRRGMALKALDADQEAAAELEALLPELRGAERLDGLLYAGRAEIWCERHEEALRHADEALTFADELGDTAGRVAAQALSADALAMRGAEGDIDRAIVLGDEALDRWPAGARGYELADHLHLQADVKYWTGDYQGAVELAVRAREAGGEAQSVHALLRGGGIDAMANVGLGEHETAIEKLEAIIGVARELGEPGAYLPNYQSVIFREVFDLEAARAANELALEAARNVAFGMPRRFALSDLLQTALLSGDVGRAQADWAALWEDASEAAGWTGWLILGRLAVARAEIALYVDPPERAAELAANAVEVTVRTRRRKYEAVARCHLGRALARLGQVEEGLAELRSAVVLADTLVNPTGRWQSRAALAAALGDVGHDESAAATTREAKDIVTGFAATLAPSRRATLLAAPQVREVLDAAC
jgi:class 3 adenylate cyclase/tetratricopeptide (TPR) repeat protein